MPAPPLSTWSLNGQSLELPAGMTREEAQSAGDLAVLTAFAVETIRQKGFTVAISIIKNTRVRQNTSISQGRPFHSYRARSPPPPLLLSPPPTKLNASYHMPNGQGLVGY